MAATIKTRILAKLFPDTDGDGSETFVSELTNETDLFEQSIWEVANMLPVKMLIGVAADPANPTSSPHSLIVHEKVLLVLRNSKEDGTGDDIACKEISVEDSFRALDTHSIHFATPRSPVFWVHRKPGASSPEVSVAPTPAAKLTVYTYKRQNVGAGSGEINYDTATYVDNIPDEAIEAICGMTAMKVMQQKLSYMSNDEEDAELYQIFQGNLQQIELALRDSIKMLTPGEGLQERDK